MDITAQQARDLMTRERNPECLPKEVREELDDIFALIERSAIKKFGSILTIKISNKAKNYLVKLGYKVENGYGTNPSLISW